MYSDKSLFITDCSISEDRELIPLRIYQPKNVDIHTSLLWVHGGSFISGTLDMPESDWVARQIAASGVAVATVDYRHASEQTRFPAPSNDVLAAWNWFNSFARKSFLPNCVQYIGGASAGGNLAAGVVNRLSDGSKPSGIILAYPVLHSELPEQSQELRTKTAILHEDLRFSPDKVRSMSLDYVGDASLFSDPIAFPANSELKAFPKVLMINSEFDDLRSSAESFAASLISAGIPTTSFVEAGTCHGHLNTPDTTESFQSIKKIIEWISKQKEPEIQN